MYVLDTNIVSISAPGRAADAVGVTAWMRRHQASLFVSVMSITEVERGILRLYRTGGARKAADLRQWLHLMTLMYGPRLLPFDLPVALVLARLGDRAQGAGLTPGLADLIIAATADTHGFTVVTRNVRHFAGLGVPVLDPYEASQGTTQ